jgi:hypothetical protein
LGAVSTSGLALGGVVFRNGEAQETKDKGIIISVSSILVGALSLAIFVPLASAQEEAAQKASEDAFVNYDQGLREVLGICQDGDRIVDCYGSDPTSGPTRKPIRDRIRDWFKRDK